MNNWYDASGKESTQGLIVEEKTGRNVAVSYDVKDAKLIAAAPAMFELLQKLYSARLEGIQVMRGVSYAIDTLLESVDGVVR